MKLLSNQGQEVCLFVVYIVVCYFIFQVLVRVVEEQMNWWHVDSV